MKHEIQREALRAAARVAFAVGLLEGCTPAVAPAVAAAPSEPPPSTDATPVVAEPADLYAKAEPTPPMSCEALVDVAFPVPSEYPGQKRDVNEEVRTCCTQLVLAGTDAEHRWDCCANAAEGALQQEVQGACTPWGPPMPPAMPGRLA